MKEYSLIEIQAKDIIEPGQILTVEGVKHVIEQVLPQCNIEGPVLPVIAFDRVDGTWL